MNHEQDSPKVTDVHQALSNAVIMGDEKAVLENITFRAEPAHKQIADDICKRHGTTLSAFLRECIKGLVIDYGGSGAS